VIVLLWVYYSAQIFLLGAEFTRAYSYSHGTRKGQERPGKANAPTRGAPATGTKATPEDEEASRDAKPSPPPVPAPRPKPAFAKLRIAAGVAATLGLAAGEFLNEWRRTRAVPRRRWWRA
jgi:membrane protein